VIRPGRSEPPKVYVLIETADVELIGLRLTVDAEKATAWFEACCEENDVIPKPPEACEIAGTGRIAGDDSYCVQLLVRDTE
jgi:hypothetical protein